MTITVALFAYAAFLSVASPRILAGRWLDRAPRIALALWHASYIGVAAAAVSMIALPAVVVILPVLLATGMVWCPHAFG